MQLVKLLLALALATTASALQHTCSQSTALQLRGGSDEEGLFGEAPDDGDDDEETKASKRYAAARMISRLAGVGWCAWQPRLHQPCRLYRGLWLCFGLDILRLLCAHKSRHWIV